MVRFISQRLLPGIGYWLGLPLVITLIGYLPGQLVTHSTLLLLYLCVVLFTSLRSEFTIVIACAITGFMCFNYFHTQPRYSFFMHADDEMLSALVFIIFALLAGRISAKLSGQLRRLREQKEFFSAQVVLNQKLQDMDDPVAISQLLNTLFGPALRFEVSFTMIPGKTDKQLPQLTWVNRHEALPDPAREAMLSSLREQIQTSLERLQTAKALKKAERESDEEKLRSALLSSVSHDLKTPLVTMLGAATTLRDLRRDLSSKDSDELLGCIISESQRLESYIQNLLDMTRLGHGKLALSRDWVSIEEIYHVVVRRITRMVAAPRITLHSNGEVPVLYVHAALIEQGLFNVIDNAIKAAGNDAQLRIETAVQDQKLLIRVADQGPGLPVTEWKAVFDSFYTFSLGDCYEKGTGLGLSICRSIFRVHGGEAEIITAPEGFNHCVQLTLPLPPANSAGDDNDQDTGDR